MSGATSDKKNHSFQNGLSFATIKLALDPPGAGHHPVSSLWRDWYRTQVDDLSRFFLQIVDELLVNLTLIDLLALPSAHLHMNLRSSLPFITNQVAHR